MTKSKDTKRALLGSLLSLMVCLAMLVGSTFAWFTDSVVSGTNKIVAGNLDVELYHQNADVTTEEKVTTDTPLFVKKGGSQVNWEPGVMVYENFTVKNVGSLALKYKLKVNVGEYNTVTVNGKEKSLKDVLKVAILDQHLTHTTRDEVINDDSIKFEKTVSDFEKIATLNAGEADKKYAMIIYWKPTEKDNDYNINNTKTVNPVATKAADTDNALFIELGVKLEATQHTVEKDSFDETYDKNAWNNMLYKDNHDGTYSDQDGNLYIKDGDNYVPVTPSTTTPAVLTDANGDMHLKIDGTTVPVTNNAGVLKTEEGNSYVPVEGEVVEVVESPVTSGAFTAKEDSTKMFVQDTKANEAVAVTQSTINEAVVEAEDGSKFVLTDKVTPVTESTTADGVLEAENGDKFTLNSNAFEAVASEGGNITALSDVEEKNSSSGWIQHPYIEIPKNTTSNINLNNNVIDIDSASGQNGIKAVDGSTTTISNGTITMNKAYGSGSPVVHAYHSTLTLDNMTVTNKNKDGVCVSAGTDGGHVIVKNSTITGGGKYSAAVFCSSQSYVTLENSTIIGAVRILNNGNLTINGGDYTQTEFSFDGSGKRVIYAGTFAQDPTKIGGGMKVDPTSTVTDNGDGTWTVTAAN